MIAYGSYDAFKADQGVQEAEQGDALVGAAPYALFGWDFFVPEDSEKSDAQLLRETAKLALRADLCESRQYFHGWLRQMYAGDVDKQDAKAEMLTMLSEYTKIMLVRDWQLRRATQRRWLKLPYRSLALRATVLA